MNIPASILSALVKHGVLNAEHENRILSAIRSGRGRMTTIEVAHALRISRREVWRRVADGRLPAPRKDGKRLRTWGYEDVSI